MSLARLPVIVGFGGYSAAGRSSSHHAYRRMVIDSLDPVVRQETIVGLAVMMGLVTYQDGSYVDAGGVVFSAAQACERFAEAVFEGTLIRKIDDSYFDVDAAFWQKSAHLRAGDTPISFEMRRRELPEPIPEGWEVNDIDEDKVQVSVVELSVKLDSFRDMPVKSAGQLPSGFEPGALYSSRYHPRALQLAVIGASDAIRSVGIEWDVIANAVMPDEVAVYASNVMSQMDEHGFGGLLQSRLKGDRVSAKQCPLGLNTMPADFVNAYILGSVGQTGAITGACASFLYNLQAACDDIHTGRARVAVVGCAEAPIVAEIIDGYATMGALASEEKLRKLDGVEEADPRRTSRPFGENAGFTMAEASQYVVLMDDALAMELGADIHGAIGDVFISADGFKKSISAPGPGNFITMAKAVASAKAVLGEDAIKNRSFVQAHGSSTPQNRVTESYIFDQVARAFGVEKWPVVAVKAYVGHSLGSASGEQLINSLGVFKYGVVPGIKTIDKVAEDVHQERLVLSVADYARDVPLDVAFLNSKGFGGNNATASVFSPRIVESMLTKRYGAEAMAIYAEKRTNVRNSAASYDSEALKGNFDTIYKFGENLVDESLIHVSESAVMLPGFDKPIEFHFENRYSDMV